MDGHQPAAALLQSWQGWMLPHKKVVTLLDVVSMITVQLPDTVTQFRQMHSLQVLLSFPDAAVAGAPARLLPPFPPACHSSDPPSISPQAPSRFTVVLPPDRPSPSPFASLPLSTVNSPDTPLLLLLDVLPSTVWFFVPNKLLFPRGVAFSLTTMLLILSSVLPRLLLGSAPRRACQRCDCHDQ